MRLVLVVLALWSGCAAAEEKPARYSHAARIQDAGEESHYRFALPADAYRGVMRPDLGDVRVFNGAGEPVPYAFVPLRPATLEPALRQTKLFPLRGEEAKGLDGVNIRIRQGRGGTSIDVSSTPGAGKAGRKLLGYLVDAADLKAPLEALVLDWQSREGFTGTTRVEASEDLKSWRTVTAAAPVLFLEHAGQRLERNRVELHGARAKYLRVSFTGVPPGFTLRRARIELRPERIEPERQWLALAGKPSDKHPGEYEFETEGYFPVDRLRFSLPQVNTVARAQVLSRNRSEDAWRAVTSATIYRLRRNGAEVTNADLVVAPNASRRWLLRVDQRGGGLGSGEVKLEVGWVPHEVVYAARGAGPFSLAWGLKVAKPGALPIAAVLPEYKEGEALTLKVASLAAPAAQAPRIRSGFSDYFQPEEAKKWALWASLVAGVLLVASMALALLKQVGKPK